jgi:hypothetical protein
MQNSVSISIFLALMIPRQHGSKKDSKCHIIHNWGEIIIVVDTRNLVVPTGHQLTSKHTISLEIKVPFAFDTLTTIRHVRFDDFLANSAHIHSLKLFMNDTYPLILESISECLKASSKLPGSIRTSSIIIAMST